MGELITDTMSELTEALSDKIGTLQADFQQKLKKDTWNRLKLSFAHLNIIPQSKIKKLKSRPGSRASSPPSTPTVGARRDKKEKDKEKTDQL